MQKSITLTTAKLVQYTLFSFTFAALLLLVVILPAEYNLDPTGIGTKLGLTAFAQKTPAQVVNNQPETNEVKNATIDVIVPPGRGVEYKFVMEQHQKLTYQWSTNGSPLYFDLHGEPKADTTGYYESYAIATLAGMEGSFTAPFAGPHGWYWKNKTAEPITVTLMVKGEYASHSLKK